MLAVPGLARPCVLAQCRGDYASAEQRYTQSLEISERLGHQPGVVTSCASLAMLMTERDAEPAIGYDIPALAIGMQMRDRRATFSLQRLARGTLTSRWRSVHADRGPVARRGIAGSSH